MLVRHDAGPVGEILDCIEGSSETSGPRCRVVGDIAVRDGGAKLRLIVQRYKQRGTSVVVDALQRRAWNVQKDRTLMLGIQGLYNVCELMNPSVKNMTTADRPRDCEVGLSIVCRPNRWTMIR